MRRVQLGIALLCLGCALPARADVVVNIGNLTLYPNQVGTVTVTISGTPGQTLSDFGMAFTIAPSGTTTDRMEFRAAQDVSFLTSPTSNYVLYGNSWMGQSSGNPGLFGTVSDGTPITDPNTVYTVFDETADNMDMTLTGNMLLATVQVTSDQQTLGPNPQPGDTFTIGVQPGSPFFDNNAGPVAYTVNPGTVTVDSVPEPTTFLSVGTGAAALAGLGWWRVRRRKRQQALRDAERSQARLAAEEAAAEEGVVEEEELEDAAEDDEYEDDEEWDESEEAYDEETSDDDDPADGVEYRQPLSQE